MNEMRVEGKYQCEECMKERVEILKSKGERCEDWTIENEKTRDFYIKLERFIIDFPELSNGIIKLYKKNRSIEWKLEQEEIKRLES